jgi:AbrB family looped-hinge helix DNA binding protein
MPAATLTSKGQITIPAAVRLALGLNAGDRVEFIQTAEGAFAIVAATHSVTALKGLVRRPSRPVSIEDMNEAIAERGASGG